MLGRKDFAWQAVRRQRQKIVVPVIDTLNLGEILSRVLLRDDLCARRIQPRIAVGMVKVPVRVDQVRDGFGAESQRELW